MKYERELQAVQKYISNPYIYDAFEKYGFVIDGEFLSMDSNISVYEACFIGLLVDTYIRNSSPSRMRILEIGLAYGTSTLILMNAILKNGLRGYYTVIDPNQTTQWKNKGIRNVEQFLKEDSRVRYKLIESDSVRVGALLRKKYDVSFIDGSHDEVVVRHDLKNSARVLKKGGLLIVDDVRHTGVGRAIEWFRRNFPGFTRITVDITRFPALSFSTDTTGAHKRSFHNPDSMFAFIKG